MMNYFLSLSLSQAVGVVFFGTILLGCLAVIVTDELVKLVVQFRLAGADEFADRDDPFALTTPWVNADGSKTFMFQSYRHGWAWLRSLTPSKLLWDQKVATQLGVKPGLCKATLQQVGSKMYNINALVEPQPTEPVVIKDDDEFRRIDMKSFTCTTCCESMSCPLAYNLQCTDNYCLAKVV